MAAFLHGQVERERGNEQAALDAYARAIDVDDLEGAVARSARFAAAKQAGVILSQRQDFAAARDFFAVAAAADEGEERARGACLLGLCERQLGNRTAAIAAFQTVLSTPDAPQELLDTAHQSLLELG
jgi:tetratricopeptide (TPR) repeat protein